MTSLASLSLQNSGYYMYKPALTKNSYILSYRRSCGSSVGIVAGRTWDFKSRRRHEIFSSLRRLDRLCGPLGLPFYGYGEAFSPGVKRQGRKAYHSSPSVAEVKNEWGCTSTLPICFHGVRKETFTFTLCSTSCTCVTCSTATDHF
jgi:hypothetical protein